MSARALSCLRCGKNQTHGSICLRCEAAGLGWDQGRNRRSPRARGYDAEYERNRMTCIRAQPWCSTCGKTKRLTAGHIVAVSRGGSSALSNLRTLCADCNQAEGARG